MGDTSLSELVETEEIVSLGLGILRVEEFIEESSPLGGSDSRALILQGINDHIMFRKSKGGSELASSVHPIPILFKSESYFVFRFSQNLKSPLTPAMT